MDYSERELVHEILTGMGFSFEIHLTDEDEFTGGDIFDVLLDDEVALKFYEPVNTYRYKPQEHGFGDDWDAVFRYYIFGCEYWFEDEDGETYGWYLDGHANLGYTLRRFLDLFGLQKELKMADIPELRYEYDLLVARNNPAQIALC